MGSEMCIRDRVAATIGSALTLVHWLRTLKGNCQIITGSSGQTQKVMQNIQQLIDECGGQMEHLVKPVVYITDVHHREALYRTMGEYIKGVHPVSTGLVVQALARPEWLVEIDGTAVIPE